MFDLGWQEFLLVALVAVIVVGPKDLPRVVRTVSQWIRKARSVASEFQGSLEEMAREADLDDVRKQLQSASKDGIGKTLEKQFDPDGQIRGSIDEARKSANAEEIESEVKESHAAVRDLTKDDVRRITGADKADADQTGTDKPGADKPGADKPGPDQTSNEIADPETARALQAAEAGAANKTSKIDRRAETAEPNPTGSPKRDEG